MTINERIQALRTEMQRESLAAYIFTSTDFPVLLTFYDLQSKELCGI